MTNIDKIMGKTVTVTPNTNDIFTHEFVGTVIGLRNGAVQVRDQDDEVFEVEFSQIS